MKKQTAYRITMILAGLALTFTTVAQQKASTESSLAECAGKKSKNHVSSYHIDPYNQLYANVVITDCTGRVSSAERLPNRKEVKRFNKQNKYKTMRTEFRKGGGFDVYTLTKEDIMKMKLSKTGRVIGS